MNRNLPIVPTSAASPPCRPRLRASGFTLLEMMITVAVAAIALGLGAPSMLRMLARHAVLAQADELRDALRGARSEAIKRGGPVIVCRTAATATRRCAQGGGDWQTWMVFADANRSGTYEAGEPVLGGREEASRRTSIGADVESLRFEPTGIALPTPGAGHVVFLLAPAGSAANATAAGDRASRRQVCVSQRGDVVVLDGNGACP